MQTIFRLCTRLSIRSAYKRPANVNLRTLGSSKYRAFVVLNSKFHLLSCHATNLSYPLNQHYAIEEEDGFEMVRVKAPPGAADTTTPGHIEWEKTVGSQVSVGEVVCRIRFKEDRTLDIQTPVAGILAGRRKQEGETVQHGDELFKVRLVTAVSKKTKKKKKKSQIDYFDEEEEFVGKTAYLAAEKQSKNNLKSAYLGKRDPSETRGISDPADSSPTSQSPHLVSGQSYPISSPQQTILTRTNMIPYPFSQSSTTPISQLMTTVNEINMEDTLNFVNEFSKVYEVTYGNKPTLRSIYIKAAAHALKLNPSLNIKLINDERVERKNIEITVGIRHLKVLVFHTMKDADKMSYIEISRVIHDIEKQVSSGTYKSEKGERGFTMATEWEIGSIVGTPSYSKTCTLGLHSTIKRPVFVENKIAAYPMMYVSLTYDRKVIEDQAAVEFLKVFKQAMEEPRHILVHIS